MNTDKILFHILIDFTKYFSLFSSIAGILLFCCMLVSLRMLKKFGFFFNKTYNSNKLETMLNKSVLADFSNSILSHSIISSFTLFVISSFLLNFFIFQFNPSKIYVLFFSACSQNVLLIFLKTLQKLFILFFILICIFSLLVIFRKKYADFLIRHLDSPYDFDKLIEDKLDSTISKDVDTICFLRNKLIGTTGLVLSICLFFLSIRNLV
jgi:hypothetical protein